MRGALLLLALALPASASISNTGGSTAQFLRIGAGARALGMGDAFSAVAEGPAAIYWNPAGLAQQRRPELGYTHIELLDFFHHEHIAYAHPIPLLRGTLGTALTFFYEDRQDLVTNRNVKVGTFKNHSEVFAFAYARAFRIGHDWGMSDRDAFADLWRLGGAEMPLRPADEIWNGNLLLGLSLKGVRSTLYDRSATAFAVDGGAIFRHYALSKMSLSFVFRNIGTKHRFINKAQDLPAEFSFAAAFDQRWDRHRVLPVFECVVPVYGVPTGRLGVEYSFPVSDDAYAAVRAGYKSLQAHEIGALSGLTGGIGFGYRHLSVDFGLQPMAVLGEAFRAEISYRF
ncbi:MAG: hypothetical protein ABIJ96_09330 [Elusimicrobiota bacterium]